MLEGAFGPGATAGEHCGTGGSSMQVAVTAPSVSLRRSIRPEGAPDSAEARLRARLLRQRGFGRMPRMRGLLLL